MPRLTVLMGAPGSGKSTYAKKSGATVVTTDGARERGQAPGDTLHSAYSQINKLLAARQEFGWLDIVGVRAGIVDILSAFIALLELARRGALRVEQPEPFASIVIRRESPREAV